MSRQCALRNLATETIASGEAWLREARFKATTESRVARMYTLSIFEQFHAALCLLDRGLGTHSPCLIRAMLEHLVDLIHVVETPGYCAQLEKENAYSDDKVITRYREAVASEPLDPKMQQELDELLAEIQERDQQKDQARKLKIDSTRQEELPLLYSLLCGMTHPNLTSLVARHKGINGELGYLMPPDPAVYDMLLSMALRLLTLTLRQLPVFTDCNSAKVVSFADSVDATALTLQQPSA